MGEIAEEIKRTFRHRYEMVFSLVLVMLAFLCRDNLNLVYPEILYLFLLFLTLNFLVVISIRLWSLHEWIVAGVILANCGTITAILEYSGGADSNLWVLYLLPINTACLLLDRRQVLLITAGAVGMNSVFLLFQEQGGAAVLFLAALKNGLLIFASATTVHLVNRERRRTAELSKERDRLHELEAQAVERERSIEGSRALIELGLVSSGVAHDLRGPLTAILGTCEFNLDSKGIEGDLRADFERIQRCAELCRSIAGTVLGVAGRRQVPESLVDVRAILRDVVSLYAESLHKNGVRCRIKNKAVGQSIVKVQPFQLQRVFLNIVANAVQAMPGGGTLILSVNDLTMRNGEKWVEISFQDSGPGIPKDIVKSLFAPFATTKPAGKGTGLGLHICRKIVAGCGGSLRVENGRAGGARFTVRLPEADRTQERGPLNGKISEGVL